MEEEEFKVFEGAGERGEAVEEGRGRRERGGQNFLFLVLVSKHKMERKFSFKQQKKFLFSSRKLKKASHRTLFYILA